MTYALDRRVGAVERSFGRIPGEAITPYPPGIPLVMPSERLDDGILGFLGALRAAGSPISASDPSMEFVTAVR
ncbi:hypothetical protein BH09ACT8_BH09ACT8_48110 [soil metagenome]